MEETSLQRKIKKQLQFIKQEVNSFKHAFETKDIKFNNFTPYLQAINKVFDLNNSYGEDYYEIIEKKNLLFVLSNNRFLLKDACTKLKQLSIFLQQDKKETRQKVKQKNGICKVCSQNIESLIILQAKNDVQGMGINKLRKMLQKMQQEGNMDLFTEDEDKHFFQQLNKVLTKKEQMLSITENHLENYLDDIMKNLKEIKSLESLKDTTFNLPQLVDWETKFKNQIHSTLLGSFKGKIPPWIQKTFDYFIKLQTKLMRQKKESKQSQTDPYIQNAVFELSKQITEFKQQQKTNKEINQANFKLIEEKNTQIQILENQISIFKEKYKLQQSKTNIRLSIFDNQKEFRSLRNSSIENQIDETIVNGQSEFKQKKASSKFNSMISNPAHVGYLTKKNKNKNNEKIEQQKHQNYQEQENHYQNGMREHMPTMPSETLQDQTIRRSNKKFTDVSYFRKTKSNERNESFLPNINKAINDSSSLQTLNAIKKTSILSKNFSRPSQKQRYELRSSFENVAYGSKLITEIQQDRQEDSRRSEINLIASLTETQRKIRNKQYKQKISDVQILLQNKVHNIEMLKKTFELKKKNLSTSLSGILSSSIVGNVGQFSKIRGQRFSSPFFSGQKKMTGVVNSSCQTDTFQSQPKKVLKNQQKLSKVSAENSLQSQFLPEKVDLKERNSNYIEIDAKQDRLKMLKRFQNHQFISKISDQHLNKILSKLFLNSQKNGQDKKLNLQTNLQQKNKSPIKSNHITQESKTNAQKQTPKKGMTQSRLLGQFKAQRSLEQKQKQNDKLQQNKNALPHILSCKQEPLKQKKIQNLNAENSSPTTKRRKETIKLKDDCNLSNVKTLQSSLIESKKNQHSLFTKKDLSLFVSEENSFKYEANMTRKYHKTPFIELTAQQIQSFTSIYNLIQLAKIHSMKRYSQILSFIKYPYQTVVNNFGILNIVRDMSLDAYLWHMSMIKYYHQKCFEGKYGNKCICGHVQKFIERIQNVVVGAIEDEGRIEESQTIHNQSEIDEMEKKETFGNKSSTEQIKACFKKSSMKKSLIMNE